MTAWLNGATPESYWCATATEPTYVLAQPGSHYDVAIIGAGYTGLNAAIALAEQGLQVALIDAQSPGWGASGRNGGFCCIGGDHLGAKAIEARYGETQAMAYCRAQLAAIEQVKSNCERYAIDADICGQGETVLAHRAKSVSALSSAKADYEHYYGATTKLLSQQDLRAEGQDSASNFSGLFVDAGFGLHPLKYCFGLVRAAQALGVSFINHTQALGLTSTAHSWCIETQTDASFSTEQNVQKAQLHARQVLFATNGYTQDAMHPNLKGRVLAAQSNILVTRPLTNEELHAQGWRSHNPSYDTRNLLYYFRLLPDNRFLFGGRSGIRQSEASFAAKRRQHTLDFQRYFPAWAKVNVDYFWRGHVALSRQLTAHVCELAPKLYCALAYHGNGVAMASWSGRKVASLMLNEAEAIAEIPLFMRNQPRSFPFPALRDGYLASAYLAYRCID